MAICRKLSGTYRPASAQIIKTVMAVAADVAPHHRFVPDECVFSCKDALVLRQLKTVTIVTVQFCAVNS